MSRPSEVAGGSLSSILPIRCSLGGQFYSSFLLTLLAPIMFVGIAALMMLPAKYVKNCIRTRRLKMPPPTFLGRFGIPQKWARWKCLRQAMTREDVRAWSAPFHVSSRLPAVTVFILFSFYPALVKSIAAIFNCTAPIEGKRYLKADMSVVCYSYEGDHIVYVALASLAGIIYAVGIPVAVAITTAFKTPIVCRAVVAITAVDGADGGKKKKRRKKNECGMTKTKQAAVQDGDITSPSDSRVDKPRKVTLKQHLETLQRKFQRKNDRRSTSSGVVSGMEMQNTLHGPTEASGDDASSTSSSSSSSSMSSSSASSSLASSSATSSSSTLSSSSYSASDSSDVQVGVDHTQFKRMWTKPRFTCTRRHHSKYATTDVRTRFGFLFAGYSTNRSGVVVSWEAIVMLRKLAVTLAGSIISDPYLAILSAQLILVISCIATALVQPYETLSLNVLDVLAMFALIVTQILSILYFYVDNTEDPFLDPKVLEVSTTALLIIINVVVFVALIGIYIWEATQRTHAYGRKMVKCVTDPVQVAKAIHSEEKTLWRHPDGTAVRKPPHKVNLLGSFVSVSSTVITASHLVLTILSQFPFFPYRVCLDVLALGANIEEAHPRLRGGTRAANPDQKLR